MGSKSHRGGRTSNGAANDIGSAVCDANDIDEEVLAWEVRGVGTNEEAGGATNDGRQTHVGLAIFVCWFLNVLERARKDCSSGAKAKVEGGAATDPSSGKYLVV